MRRAKRSWERLAVAVLVVVAVCAVSSLVTVADDECYTDVRISGTGNTWVNGYHAFSYMHNDRPNFDNWYATETQVLMIDIYYSIGAGEWRCYIAYVECTDPQEPWGTEIASVEYMFEVTSDSATPPGTGWTLHHENVEDTEEDFVVSPPTMSGGQPCPPPSFVITGLGPGGAILDQSLDLAEGEEPPMVGLRPLAAVYNVGDLVTGACSIDDEAGSTVRGTYIHDYIYSVDIGPRPEVLTLLDHWTVHYDSDRGGYSYSWDTSGYAPGYYDVYLSFGDGSSRTYRILLNMPLE